MMHRPRQVALAAFIVSVLSMQPAAAGLFGAAKFPLKHPIATAVLAAGGYATIKSYCAAGGPAVSVDDGSGRSRKARIDCANVGAGLENKLGDIAEDVDAKEGVLSKLKHAVAKKSTVQLRKNLNEERIAQGLPPDPDDCDAHHIVPKNEARPWAAKSAKVARDALEGCISIDDADNGVYLPGKKDGSSQCSGAYHKTLHTKPYYDQLSQRLSNARDFGGCADVRKELLSVKRLLQSGAL